MAAMEGQQEAIRTHLIQRVLAGEPIDGLADFVDEVEREMARRQ
jgi:hypothetical protein